MHFIVLNEVDSLYKNYQLLFFLLLSNKIVNGFVWHRDEAMANQPVNSFV